MLLLLLQFDLHHIILLRLAFADNFFLSPTPVHKQSICDLTPFAVKDPYDGERTFCLPAMANMATLMTSFCQDD